MNPISGPTQSAAIGALFTTGAVRAVRPVTSNTQRASDGVDRFVRSAPQSAQPQVTYGRNGRGASVADADGDLD